MIAFRKNLGWLVVLATMVTSLMCSMALASPFKTEIIVRTVKNLHNHSEVVSFLNMAARHNVDVINLAVKQDEDDEVPSGVVFYASTIAPRAPGSTSSRTAGRSTDWRTRRAPWAFAHRRASARDPHRRLGRAICRPLASKPPSARPRSPAHRQSCRSREPTDHPEASF